ncbi:MAG: MFS transporter [Nocardioidaceae bacterium]|nr:MFS transporter [Nocardioidaceae bacterium]MCL2613417.1 MFS transporter [Nocardioidaceae bacterium]
MSSTLTSPPGPAATAAPAGSPAPQAETGSRGLGIGTYLVLLAQLMLVLDGTVVNVAIPHIATDLHFSDSGLSWILNGYTLAFGGLLLLGGRLGDVLGRRRLFRIGLATFTLASAAGGVAPTAGILVAARALQGVGAALAAPSVLALITTSAPTPAARNRALAAFTAVSSGGGALGLILGGALTDAVSWRWTLFINVPIGIAVLALVGRYVGETERRHGRFDFVGAVSSTGAAVSLVWALIGVPQHGWESARTIGGLAIGVALFAVLAATELRVSHPLLRPGLLKDRRRVAALVTMAGMYGAMLSMFFVMTQFLEDDLRFGPLTTGLAFLPLPMSVFALSRVMPRLVARFGQVPWIVAGTIGITAAFVRLAFLPDGAGYWDGAFPSVLVLGLSAGMTFMPITSLVLTGVEPEHAGSASGLLQTMQQLGGSIGLAVVASSFASHAVPTDFLAGARYGFGTAAVIGAMALLAALTLVTPARCHLSTPETSALHG